MSRYDDIIHLPHHQSAKRPHMSRIDRAAQFSPFAALTGHDGAIKETARLTDRRIELDEDQLVRLDEQFQKLRERLPEHPEVTITYFVPDDKKAGGRYVTVIGIVKKIRDYEQEIVMENGPVIHIGDMIEIVI